MYHYKFNVPLYKKQTFNDQTIHSRNAVVTGFINLIYSVEILSEMGVCLWGEWILLLVYYIICCNHRETYNM